MNEKRGVPIRLEMFGDLSLTVENVVHRQFRTQRTEALCAFLALYPGRVHSRDQLADLFWPDSDPERARLNLRVALTSLRKMFTPHNALSANRLTVQIDRGAISTDVQDFEEALKEAKNCPNPLQKRTHLERACHLYNGPLLPNLYDDWASRARQHLAGAFLQAAGELSEFYAEGGELAKAIHFAEICSHEEPFDETSVRRLIGLLSSAGRQKEALERFNNFERRLQREAGLESSPHLLAYVDQVFGEGRKSKGLTPPPKKRAARRTAPLYLTSFIGRDSELQFLQDRLLSPGDTSRLITVVGPGGFGKTRLLTEFTQKFGVHFPGGAWFVDLSSYEDPRKIPRAIAAAMGLQPEIAASGIDGIAGSLGSGRTLIGLDNMEQLLEKKVDEPSQALEAIQSLLALSPGLSFLATSRQPLGIAGEMVLRLSPLPVPESNCPPSQLLEVSSVELFVSRARLTDPDFQLTDTNSPFVLELCRKLEGNPLAIELAAAWIQVLSPLQILENMRGKDFPHTRRYGTPKRHRSLRATIAWSFELLPQELKRVMTDLSVFRGGCGLESAMAVCRSKNLVANLADLQERSLVQSTAVRGTTRYSLFDSVREYARSFSDSNWTSELSRRHAKFFHQFAGSIEQWFKSGAEGGDVTQFQVEDDNFGVALTWALDNDPELAANILCNLSKYWYVTYRDAEACDWFDRLDTERLRDVALRSNTELAFARFEIRRQNVPGARKVLSRLLPVVAASGQTALEAKALYLLAHLDLLEGGLQSAEEAFKRALAFFTELELEADIVLCLINLGEVEIRRGHLHLASTYGRQAVLACEKFGDFRLLVVAMGNLGEIALYTGHFEEAIKLFEREIELCEKSGDLVWKALAWNNIGVVRAANSEFCSARRSLVQSMEILESVSDSVAKMIVRCEMANLDRLEGNGQRAESEFNQILLEVPQTSRAGLMAQLGLIALGLDRKDLPYLSARLRVCLSNVIETGCAKDAMQVLDAASYYLAFQGQIQEAAKLMGDVQSLRRSTGFVRPPADATLHAELAELVAYKAVEGDPSKRGQTMEFAEICKRALLAMSS